MGETKPNVSAAAIESKIYTIRGQKVILDHDLAELYGGVDESAQASG